MPLHILEQPSSRSCGAGEPGGSESADGVSLAWQACCFQAWRYRVHMHLLLI